MTAELLSCFPNSSCPKVAAVQVTLQDTIKSFRDLVEQYEELNKENMDYKSKLLILTDKSNCRIMNGEVKLKKQLQQKNDLIEKISLALKKLLETKDFGIINQITKLIDGESNPHHSNTPLSGMNQDESLSEIEGTPGRKSPIITMSKKNKSCTTSNSSQVNKKIEESRATPEKSLKLIFPSPSRNQRGGRLKQSRLNVLKEKSSFVVDLTCSPGTLNLDDDNDLKSNVRKDAPDYDETILPSPTSTPILAQILKTKSKDSPRKFKKPQSPIKLRMEETEIPKDKNQNCSETYTQFSIDLMKHCKRNLKVNKSVNKDENYVCDANDSVSLLQNSSPQKEPLCENNNLLNTEVHIDSSLSILQRNVRVSPPHPIPKRTKLELIEPVYKEPTLRKKSEKRALPGWSCDNCKQFYGALYADNPDMLAQKMEECSKHRGRNNPIRPSTPDGFWEMRWDVPEDTEEFNRRNNV